MYRKLLSLLLAVLTLVCVFSGCDAVGEIAGSVADAAKEELEAQIQAVLDEYKVEVVELKTTAGKLNNTGGSVQFFCAVLVRAENIALPQSCADALGGIFEKTGVIVQTNSKIVSEYLVNKELSYNFTDFGDGATYYTIFAYTSVISGSSNTSGSK